MLHSKGAVKWRGIGKKRLRRNTFDLLPGIPTDPGDQVLTVMDVNTHTHTHTHAQTHTEPINIKALKQAKERP